MRVLAMVHAYPPHHNAGAEMTIHAFLLQLVNEGHDVEVLVSGHKPGIPSWYHHDTVSVHTNLGDAGPFRWFGTSRKPDVVLAHLENTLRASALCSIHGVPLVHVLHNDHPFTKGALLRGPTQLALFNSEWMAQDYAKFWEQHSIKPLPPSVTIHPPVDPVPFADVTPGQHATLINLNEGKGGSLFWRLAAALPRRKFLGVRGAYGDQVIPDEIPPNVVVSEHRQPAAMPLVYGETRVLLMPSDYESYGRVAIEAAHCGIPTIAHPTPGLREALGDAGTFVDRDDIDGWIAALSRLYTPKGWAAASRKAKAHAEALTPEDDLMRFVRAVEGVVRRGLATYAG